MVMADRAGRRQADDHGNLCWLELTVSREDAFVILQKLSSSCENTPFPAFRTVRSLVTLPHLSSVY